MQWELYQSGEHIDNAKECIISSMIKTTMELNSRGVNEGAIKVKSLVHEIDKKQTKTFNKYLIEYNGELSYEYVKSDSPPAKIYSADIYSAYYTIALTDRSTDTDKWNVAMDTYINPDKCLFVTNELHTMDNQLERLSRIEAELDSFFK